MTAFLHKLEGAPSLPYSQTVATRQQCGICGPRFAADTFFVPAFRPPSRSVDQWS